MADYCSSQPQSLVAEAYWCALDGSVKWDYRCIGSYVDRERIKESQSYIAWTDKFRQCTLVTATVMLVQPPAAGTAD